MRERPAGVPEEAFWSEEENEWCLAPRDAENSFHGLVTWWRPDGTRCCTTDFVHGSPYGSFTRYHEGGEVSREGAFEEGELHGTHVFQRSTSATTEEFPRGLDDTVHRAEMDYDKGQVVAARYYDVNGRQCMEDGESFPEARPEGVPGDAHFGKREDDGEYRWVSGSVVDQEDGTMARTGPWRFWSPAGVLVAEEIYQEGKRHGAAKTYNEESGVLLQEVSWREGERHGAARTFSPQGELLEERTFTGGKKKGPRVVLLDEELRGAAMRERGEFEDDDPVGVIEYLDAAGKVIARVDTGKPADLEATQAVLNAEEGFAPLAQELLTAQQLGAGIFALARAVGREEASAELLEQKLAALARPLSDNAAAKITQLTQTIVDNVQRFGCDADECINRAFEGIRRGGIGPDLLRFGAAVLDDMDQSRIALELVSAAIAIVPAEKGSSYEYTRALVRASLGHRSGALGSVKILGEHHPEQAKGIASYIRAIFPQWDFWPQEDSRRAGLEQLASLLQRTTLKQMNDVAAFRVAIQKGATRLVHHRQRLLEIFGDQDWIVPDVSHLLIDGPVEVLIPDRYEGIGVHHLARQDWIRLTWLCHHAGLDALGLPEQVMPRDDAMPLQLVAIARYYFAFGEDPAEALQEILSRSDVADPANVEQVVATAIDVARRSDWFGLAIAELQEAPDLSFIQIDENAFLDTLYFSAKAEIDLFGEHQEDEESD